MARQREQDVDLSGGSKLWEGTYPWEKRLEDGLFNNTVAQVPLGACLWTDESRAVSW